MSKSVAEFLPLAYLPDIEVMKSLPVWVRDSHIELFEVLLGDVICRQLLPEALGPELSALVGFKLEMSTDMTVAGIRCIPKLEGWQMPAVMSSGPLLCDARVLDVLLLPIDATQNVRRLWLLVALLSRALDELASNAIETRRQTGSCQLAEAATFRLGFSVRLPRFSSIEAFLGHLLGGGYDLSGVEAALEKFWKNAENAGEVT